MFSLRRGCKNLQQELRPRILVLLLVAICLSFFLLESLDLFRLKQNPSFAVDWEGENATEEEPPSGNNNPVPADDTSMPKDDKILKANQSVAICLVGGARKFELTGPTIIEHLLRAYPDVEVFLHAPLDEDSHKFSVLLAASVPVVAVRIFGPSPLLETGAPQRVLTASNSPNAIQGLLQYFNLVEGCLTLIEERERVRGSAFDWVVRARVDSFWSGPAPSLETLPQDKYTVPLGSSYAGLNDRFGIGKRKLNEVALARLKILPQLADLGYNGLNSEKSFLAQFQSHGVAVHREFLNFCVLSEREYAWPFAASGVPVASITSTGALSGAKCRPCMPAMWGEKAMGLLATLNRGWGELVVKGGIHLCDASGKWPSDWESVFDQVVGPEGAHVRMAINGRSHTECVTDLENLAKHVKSGWQSPPPSAICARRALGALRVLDGGNGKRWGVFTHMLQLASLRKQGRTGATVYAVGYMSELDLLRSLLAVGENVSVRGFDPSPEAEEWVRNSQSQAMSKTWTTSNQVLGPEKGTTRLRQVKAENQVIGWSPMRALGAGHDWGSSVNCTTRTVAAAMDLFGDKIIDLLLVSLLVDSATWLGQDARVCQLIVRFDWRAVEDPERRRTALMADLEKRAMHLAMCYGNGNGAEQCTFFSSRDCELLSQ